MQTGNGYTASPHQLLRFWTELLECAKARTALYADVTATSKHWLTAKSGVLGVTFLFVFNRGKPRAELLIRRRDKADNKRIYDAFHQKQVQIEHSAGERLAWKRLDEKANSKIEMPVAGSIENEVNWPTLQASMVDAMVRLEKAVRPTLDALRRNA